MSIIHVPLSRCESIFRCPLDTCPSLVGPFGICIKVEYQFIANFTEEVICRYVQSKSTRYPCKSVMLVSLQVLRALTSFYFQKKNESGKIISLPEIKTVTSKQDRSQQGYSQLNCNLNERNINVLKTESSHQKGYCLLGSPEMGGIQPCQPSHCTKEGSPYYRFLNQHYGADTHAAAPYSPLRCLFLSLIINQRSHWSFEF